MIPMAVMSLEHRIPVARSAEPVSRVQCTHAAFESVVSLHEVVRTKPDLGHRVLERHLFGPWRTSDEAVR
jgi:hypothetical protein